MELAMAITTNVKFYLGRIFDPVQGKVIDVLKKDVLIELFGVAWMPFHVVKIEGNIMELPGFRSKQVLE